jgi:hypothetical protein
MVELVVSLQAGYQPEKLNTVIQPLMAAIRHATDVVIRKTAADGIAEFALQCSARASSPNDR